MPILGKSARACFDAFVGHLNPLVHAMLPTRTPLYAEVLDERPNLAMLGFQGVYTIPLASSHGLIHVHLGQSLECTEDKKRSTDQRFQLRTRKYWYRLQRDPAPLGGPVVGSCRSAPQNLGLEAVRG